MGVGEVRFVGIGEAGGVLPLQHQHLVQRQPAAIAGRHVDVAGQQIGLQCGGVADGPDHEPLEIRRVTRPFRVALQHDLAALLDGGDAVGAVIQPGIGRIAVVQAALDILARAVRGVEHRLLQMRRQQLAQLIELVVGFAQMHHRRLRIHHIHPRDARPGPGVGEAAIRVAPDAGGEGEVRRAQRRPVAPGQPGTEPPSHRHALALRHHAAIGDAGKLGAQQAAEMAVGIERHHRTVAEAQYVELARIRIDRRVQGRRERRHADHQRGVRLRLGRAACQQQRERSRPDQAGCQFSAQ